MEGPSPGDLQVNQEKLTVINDEYRRLCYEMKKKEVSRNSTHTKMQQHIRQQWETILELKKKKSELTLQLRLQESESFSNRANQNLEIFLKSLDEMMKIEKHIKDQNYELEECKQKISKLEKKLRLKQKEVVRAQRSKGRVLKYQNNISFLENRLNSSLNRYNQLLVSNYHLREDINSLLLSQSSFRRKYSKIKRLLAAGKKTLSEVVHSATMSYQTGESVKYKLNLIKERTEVDQKKLGEKIKELKILVEQDRQLKDFLEFKLKDRSSSSESEEITRNEQIIEQRLQAYHGILARIQLASNCKDVTQLCKAYSQGEEINLNLFEKVNELSLQIEKMNDQVRAERQELDNVTQQYKEQNRKDLAVKHDIENLTDKLRVEACQLEDAADAKADELESVKEILQRIYLNLNQVSNRQVSFSVSEGVTDDNILQYLETLEKRVVDLIKFTKLLDTQSFDTQQLQDQKTSHDRPLSVRKTSHSYKQKSIKSVKTSSSEREQTDVSQDIPYNKQNLEAFARNYQQK